MTTHQLPPDTDSEAAAEPTAVDEPERIIVRELPAERTTAPDIEDTGAIWDETFPGETQGMPEAARPRLLASRVTTVSDSVLFGAAILGPDSEVFQLVPAHRDRLRVTLQVIQGVDEPDVYISTDRNITPSTNAWHMQDISPLRLETRDGIYVLTVGGTGTSRIQWAIELVAESTLV